MTTTLFLLLSLLILQDDVRRPPAQEAAPGGEIRGRVTDKETGHPIARAAVNLVKFDKDRMDELTTSTDAAGVYRFARLAPGQYDGLVSGGAFRETHQVQSLAQAAGQGRWVVLKDGEVRTIDVALRRTHAVAVRIVDEWGDPLSGLPVSVHSAGTGQRGHQGPPRSTDDHGRLRVFGLTPGRYIVCAEGDGSGTSASRDSRRGPERLIRTCYPSAADEAEAEAVRVDGSDIAELEIRMRTGRTFTISGRVVDASGAPAAGALLGLARHQGGSVTSSRRSVGEDGRFTLTNVPPGEYAIEASTGGPESPERRRGFEAEFLPIRVEGSDLEDVVVSLKKGADVAGRITLEDPAAPFPPERASGLMVQARLAGDRLRGAGSTLTAFVRDERRFVLTGTFGRRLLEFANVPRGWYVKSVRYEGNEIIDQPTELKAGTDPSRLEVVLSNRGAVVTGRMVDARGVPFGGARLFLFRADGVQSRVTEALTAKDGTFRVGPVRGGDYFIVALPLTARAPETGEWDRLARLAAIAQRVTLDDVDARILDVPVVTER
jgi:hypothetical protein